MQIQVTQKDILSGIAGDCSACPVALALFRATGADIKVGPEEIAVGHSTYISPLVVRDFVDAFDARKMVWPFTFELPINP